MASGVACSRLSACALGKYIAALINNIKPSESRPKQSESVRSRPKAARSRPKASEAIHVFSSSREHSTWARLQQKYNRAQQIVNRARPCWHCQRASEVMMGSERIPDPQDPRSAHGYPGEPFASSRSLEGPMFVFRGFCSVHVNDVSLVNGPTCT